MKTIIIVILTLGLAAAGYFLFRGGEEVSNTNTVVSETKVQSDVKEITISGFEYGYSPESLEINSGEKIKIIFKNTGNTSHDFRIEELNIGTKIIGGGQTDTLEFTAPSTGTYTFYCSVGNHRALGMEGSLEVK